MLQQCSRITGESKCSLSTTTHALDNHHIIVGGVWNLIPSPTSPVASNLVTLNSEVLGSWSFDLEILDFNNSKAQWHSDYEALMQTFHLPVIFHELKASPHLVTVPSSDDHPATRADIASSMSFLACGGINILQWAVRLRASLPAGCSLVLRTAITHQYVTRLQLTGCKSLPRMKLLSSSFWALFQNVPKACWRILLCSAIVATDQPSLNLWQLPPHLQFRTKFATTSKLIPLSKLLLLQAQSCDDEFLVSKAKTRQLNASGSRGRSSRGENPKPKSQTFLIFIMTNSHQIQDIIWIQELAWL